MIRILRQWIPGQPAWRDLIAGLSVAGVLLPEAVAYAGIGNLPPQAGVMALLAGLLAYGLLGSSRFAIVSATSSSAAVLLAATASMAGTDIALRMSLAVGLVLLTGLYFVIGSMAKLGAVSAFIARPVLRGFAFGLAVIIIIKQGPKLVGLLPNGHGAGQVAWHLLEQFQSWHVPSLLVGGVALVTLFALQRVKRRWPGALLVMVAGIAAQHLGLLEHWGVLRVGDFSVHLQAPDLPALAREHWLRLGELALAMVLILYAESYGSIRTLALRHGDVISPNRDLFALGIANLFSSLLHGMPVGAGYSASVVNEASGAKSKWSGLFAALLILIVIATLLPLLADMPEPVLGAIVIHAVSHTLNPQVFQPYFQWRRDRLLVLGAIAAVLWLGVLDGLLASIGASLFLTLRGLAQARVVELGRVGDTHDFIDIELSPRVHRVPDVLILRPEAPLFFGNVERMLGQVRHVLDAQVGVKTLVLSLEESPDLDGSCVEALRDLSFELAKSGRRLVLGRLKAPAYGVLLRAALTDTQLTMLSMEEAVSMASTPPAAQA
ncbi:SulP family inorganic anion transporter [Aquabacterium sp.]|uniref:SulP family inorganic anion transporter n=1 Tax=Aquabacterium sp. TaxID=1872578 RepID=UPI0035B299EF